MNKAFIKEIKNIAVIGGGFAGLATLYHLKKHFTGEFSLFDPRELGENASGISAGLLHAYAGAKGKLVRDGREGYAATLELLEFAQRHTKKEVAQKKGFLRIALREEQKQFFLDSSKKYHEDLEWWEAEQCQQAISALSPHPGIFIPSAYSIQTLHYLEGLWEGLRKEGVNWVKKEVRSLKELDAYDLVIVAGGAFTREIKECQHLPINQIKGQIAELEWPADLPALPYPIGSKMYIIPNPSKGTCMVGATFERNFISKDPDEVVFRERLLPELQELLPSFKTPKIISIRSGLRASAPRHLPMIHQLSERHWVLTGFGSKGLLYHSLYAKRAVELTQSI